MGQAVPLSWSAPGAGTARLRAGGLGDLSLCLPWQLAGQRRCRSPTPRKSILQASCPWNGARLGWVLCLGVWLGVRAIGLSLTPLETTVCPRRHRWLSIQEFPGSMGFRRVWLVNCCCVTSNPGSERTGTRSPSVALRLAGIALLHGALFWDPASHA